MSLPDWFHLVFVVERIDSSANCEFYINGVALPAPAYEWSEYDSIVTSGAMYIGADSDGAGHVSMMVDELLIFTHQLNQSDVEMLYQSYP